MFFVANTHTIYLGYEFSEFLKFHRGSFVVWIRFEQVILYLHVSTVSLKSLK